MYNTIFLLLFYRFWYGFLKLAVNLYENKKLISILLQLGDMELFNAHGLYILFFSFKLMIDIDTLNTKSSYYIILKGIIFLI